MDDGVDRALRHAPRLLEQSQPSIGAVQNVIYDSPGATRAILGMNRSLSDAATQIKVRVTIPFGPAIALGAMKGWRLWSCS
jgi:hypothetical protein